MKIIIRIFLLLLFFCTELTAADKLVSFKDEIILDNGVVRIGIAPSVGRIVTFGYSNGLNLLWRNYDKQIPRDKSNKRRWLNYGGNKLWPNSQASWKILQGADWPPDEFLDGSKWTVVSKDKISVTIESPVSPYSHISFRREITLLPGHPVVRIKNSQRQHLFSPCLVFIWSVTQALIPEYCLLGSLNKKVSAINSKHSTTTTMGHWIAAIYPDSIFLQCTNIAPDGNYTEKHSVKCFYAIFDKKHSYWNNRKPISSNDFVELELLGPGEKLKPGQSIENVVYWKLIDRPQNKSHEDIIKILNRESFNLLRE